MEILWLVLFLLFLWIEAQTISIVSIWFAVGALAAALCGILGGELWLQAVVFFCISGILLALLRPVVRKHFTPKLTKTNVDAVVGTTGKVLKRIDNEAAEGQVKLGSMEWTARSTTGAPIEEGTLIRVDRIEGVKVFVSLAEIKEQV